MLNKRKKRYDEFDLYEYADLIFKTLERRYIALFNRLKNLPDDEKAVIEAVNKVYAEVDDITRKYLLLLAKKVYKQIIKELDGDFFLEIISYEWLMGILEAYDPVTKYVYTHEVDRKRARTVESIIASQDKPKEVDTAKKQFSKQAKQYADNVVISAVEQAFTDMNIKEVVWETEEDLRVCPVCEDLDGLIFRMQDVPPKPHYGCRCWLTPLEIWTRNE